MRLHFYLVLVLSFSLRAQIDSPELLELRNEETSIKSQIQGFRLQKNNELQLKNEELTSLRTSFTSKQSTQRELTSNFNQLSKEFENYHSNEVKLNLYNQFINQLFFKATEMSKDVQKFYDLIIEENHIPIDSKFMLFDKAVIYTYSVDSEGYISSYKILNSSDKLKKKFEKFKEKEQLVVIPETGIEIYRLTGIDAHYFDLKQDLSALDIKLKAISKDIASSNSSITKLKQDLINLENTWNRKINFKVDELLVIQKSIESLNFKTVTIGTQVWMAENLNVDHFSNGDPIEELEDNGDWYQNGDNEIPAWCHYNNDPTNGEKYGKLYNWHVVIDSRNVCPIGWHVPTDEEWQELVDYVGGDDFAGAKLKAIDGWFYDGNGSDGYGFSGLPGGARYYDGSFDYIGSDGYWWSSSEYSTYSACYRTLYYGNGNVNRSNYNKTNGFSVRCLRD